MFSRVNFRIEVATVRFQVEELSVAFSYKFNS